MRRTAACLALPLVVAQTDLSRPFNKSSNYGTHTALLDVLMQLTDIKTAVLLNHSEIALDYARADTYGVDSLQFQWSVTKSWSSFLVGVLIDQGFLESEHVTLEEIFSSPEYDATWAAVDCKKSKKKKITVKELLTMTSGFWDAWDFDNWHANADSLADALNKPWFKGVRGSFAYTNPSILAYVIYACSNQTVLEFANSTGALAALDINTRDICWQQNAEGHETIGTGLYASAVQMAKLGQLYLQKGRSGDAQVVSRSWVEKSQHAVTWEGALDGDYSWFWEASCYDWGDDDEDDDGDEDDDDDGWTPRWYGYLWKLFGDVAPYNTTVAAEGADGQYIVIFQEHDAVFTCTAECEPASVALVEIVEDYLRGQREFDVSDYYTPGACSYSYSFTDIDDCNSYAPTMPPTLRPTMAPTPRASYDTTPRAEFSAGDPGAVFSAGVIVGSVFACLVGFEGLIP